LRNDRAGSTHLVAGLYEACREHAPVLALSGEMPRQLQGVKAEGPAIVDCVVAADELPNLPHLDLEKIGNFADAKIKEAVLAPTGR
jgi:pyruvate dehydrogenase (quinone)